MLTVEAELSKRVTTTYQWSPHLKQAVCSLRYWMLHLRQTKGTPISLIQLKRLKMQGGISDQDHAPLLPEVEIKVAQHKAYNRLKELQKQHQELRDRYLEGLAEAIVLDRSPDLGNDPTRAVLVERKEKQIKQILSREKICRMYRKIGSALHKSKGKGLSRIDVPDEAAASYTSGDPSDPKQWKGPWRSVTNPNEIARVVCKFNTQQYHQAHHTPFGSGPLAALFGRRGDTPTSEELLHGTLPNSLPPNLLPETMRVLHTMATPTPITQGSTIVTDENFVQTYTVADETTSSSPSGRYIGHYKSTLKHPNLVSLHAQMMSLPFQVVFAPQRWTKVTDIMLDKEANNPHCHCLRILALFESDLNHAKRLIIGRRLLHHLNDQGMLPSMKHGSVPGKHCLSAAQFLKKFLVMITCGLLSGLAPSSRMMRWGAMTGWSTI
jgi:hypothetical protein